VVLDDASERVLLMRRHRFIVWYRDGQDVMARLPLLSTYPGHACVSDTEVYLRITTALLQEANTQEAAEQARNRGSGAHERSPAAGSRSSAKARKRRRRTGQRVYTMIGDNLEVPFGTTVLGVDVTVEDVDLKEGPLASAVWPVLPGRRGTAGRARCHRGSRHHLPVGPALHSGVHRGRQTMPARSW